MESKEYFQSLMSVIEYVASGHSEITCEKGTELSCEYWAAFSSCLRMSISGLDWKEEIFTLHNLNT